jgi:hypothetical protein
MNAGARFQAASQSLFDHNSSNPYAAPIITKKLPTQDSAIRKQQMKSVEKPRQLQSFNVSSMTATIPPPKRYYVVLCS